MDPDAMDDDAASGVQFAERIPVTAFEREAVEFTTREVERLNAAVRAHPEIGARSEFFQDETNVVKGLPVFQGKHTRFVYDEEEGEEIVAVVDVTQEALNNGPVVRTVAELDEDVNDEEEEGSEAEAGEETTGFNMFCSTDEACSMMEDGVQVDTLMEDVEMEMAAVAIDERKLMDAAVKRR